MKALKYSLLAILSTFIVYTSAAQNKSEAEFVKMSKEYKLNTDGSYDMRCKKQLKLFTHIAFNSLYGETFIVYNPKHQQVKINECYAIQADGNRVDAPLNAFNEVLPRFAANAPYYNNLRELVVTHTGLELGATIYLDYTLHTNAGYTNGLLVNDILQETSPVKEYTLSVEYPASVALLYNQYNIEKPAEKQNNGTITLTWSAKNIPAQSAETLQPADGRELARVAFSTIIGSKMINLLAAQFTQAGSGIQKQVSNLTANAADSKEKIDAITNYVIKNIPSVNIPLEYTGYKIRTVDEVYRTSYGTPLEKAALLSAMLTIAGIENTPVYTTPTWTGEANTAIPMTKEGSDFLFFLAGANDFPILLENNRYISALRAEKIMWNDIDSDCYTFKPNTGKKVPTIMKGVDINYTYSINGRANENGKVVFELLKNGGYSVVSASNTKINNVTENDEHRKDLTASENNNYYTIKLPVSHVGVNSWWGTYSLSAEPRKASLKIPYPINESYTYNCTLPSGMQLANKDTDVKITNAVGEVVISIKANTITRAIKLNSSLIESKDYKAFKELMDAWNTANYRTIVVK